MQPRLETLKRLAALYAAVEEMHSAELQRVTSALREAQHAIGGEMDVARSARGERRRALITGDDVGRMMAETRRETAELRGHALEQIRREREELNDRARKQYVASRLKREQMERVFDDIAARMGIEEGRRMQAVSDDRFLALKRWTNAQQRMRGDEEMKVS
jgi:hypothetical protein